MKITVKDLDRMLENDDELLDDDELVGGKEKIKTPDGQQRKKDINTYNKVPEQKRDNKKMKF